MQGAPSTTVSPLNGLDPQARCDRAARLVISSRRWPMICRRRQPGDQLQGQAFPPPPGDPPFDDALFAPPSERWRAPTTRPTADDLVRLQARFFSDA